MTNLYYADSGLFSVGMATSCTWKETRRWMLVKQVDIYGDDTHTTVFPLRRVRQTALTTLPVNPATTTRTQQLLNGVRSTPVDVH